METEADNSKFVVSLSYSARKYLKTNNTNNKKKKLKLNHDIKILASDQTYP